MVSITEPLLGMGLNEVFKVKPLRGFIEEAFHLGWVTAPP